MPQYIVQIYPIQPPSSTRYDGKHDAAAHSIVTSPTIDLTTMAHLTAVRPLLLQVALLILQLANLSFAQYREVALVYPPRVRARAPKIFFQPEEQVVLRWNSTFPIISLELYQGPRADGHWEMFKLLTNVSNATTILPWTANVLPGMKRSDPFHLRLFYPDNPDCSRCHSNSSEFQIVDGSATATPTPGPDASSGSDSGVDSGLGSDSSSLRLGLGLGLGLGVPLLVLATALATWVCVRKRRRAREEGASQTGGPLVDWKGERRDGLAAGGEGAMGDGKSGLVGEAFHAKRDMDTPEMEGSDLVEMSGVSRAVEASNDGAVAELEGRS